jgi:hypothetical protein
MKCRPVNSLTRDEQANVLFTLLEMVVPAGAGAHLQPSPSSPSHGEAKDVDATDEKQQVDTLAAIHHRFWRLERIADLYFELMEAFPECSSQIVAFLETAKAQGRVEWSCGWRIPIRSGHRFPGRRSRGLAD